MIDTYTSSIGVDSALIPTEQILTDIKDTEKEMIDMQDELDVLMRNPQVNKVRIYFLEGGLSSRKDFISNLNSIVEYRKPTLTENINGEPI